MTAPVIALSLSNRAQEYGSYAGFAAVIGLAVLALLYFAQAREVKRLREWAGRAPERAAEEQARVTAAASAARAVPGAGGVPTVARPGAPVTGNGAQGGAVPATAAAAARAATAVPGAPASPRPGGAPAPVPAGAPAAGRPAGAPQPGTPGQPQVQPGQPQPAAKPGAPAQPGTPSPASPPPGRPQPQPAAKPGQPATGPGDAPQPAATPSPPPAGPEPVAAGATQVTTARPGVGAATAAGAAGATTSAAAATPAGGGQRYAPLRPPDPDLGDGAADGDQGRFSGSLGRILAIAGGVVVVGALAVLLITGVLGGSSGSTSTTPPNTIGQTPPARTPSSPGAAPRVNRASKQVAVLNGTTTQGLARGAHDRLVKAGYPDTIPPATDKNNQLRKQTIVLYADAEKNTARDVARLLGVPGSHVQTFASQPDGAGLRSQAPQNSAVVVVLGSDKATQLTG